jgi:3-oxoacyl-[acyl-carrier-protein] synthase-3
VAVGILGIAYHLPDRVETNEDLLRQNPDWLMDRVGDRLGIRSRHIAAPGETASDLGFQAARRLLREAGAKPDEIDYLLFCTQSPDYFLPSAACILQDRLGLGKHVGALDFNLGCSGYVYGLHLAKCLIACGQARRVLLIVADTYSKFIHPRDRTVRVLFGDGAAATLIGPTDGPGIGEFVLGTDGAGANDLIVPSGGLRQPHSSETAREMTDLTGCTRTQDHLFMDGQAIFDFAMTVVPRNVRALLAKAKLAAHQVDWYAYHQANQFMLEGLAAESSIPMAKMVLSFEDVGNTVSASIPIAVQRYVEAGKIRPGHQVMMVGFGVGYSWGACLVTWG